MSGKTVIDLFCGCGGLSYGFSMAGYKILLGLDNDKAAIQTFQKNHSGSTGINCDILNLKGEDILEMMGKKKVDLVIGGPPCQGVSLSGPRKIDDPRNKLFFSFVNITAEIMPKSFVMENVPGLGSLYKGKIIEFIIEEFSKIGYSVNTKILTAADYGVPQLRKRLFIVGIKNSRKSYLFPQATNSRETDEGELLKKYVSCGEAIGDLPSLENEEGLEKQIYPSHPQNYYQKIMREDSKFVYNHIVTKHSDRVQKIISMVPEGGNYKNLPEEYKKTRKFNVAWTRYSSKEPASTIDTGHRHHFHYKYNRVPTVRENARLQSFPDRFIFSGNKTQQYRQVGNAVPPLLSKQIGESILKCL
ncbi:DNA cytosine methyltransferase [Patescibacteria group bacterium]|nr:DNA cytosine methyltransferase [Patescibacteria group bacterium]